MIFASTVQKFVFCMCATVVSVFVFRSGSGLKIQRKVGAVACKVPKFSLCIGVVVCLLFFSKQHKFNLRECGCLYGAQACFRCGRVLWAGLFLPATPATSVADL